MNNNALQDKMFEKKAHLQALERQHALLEIDLAELTVRIMKASIEAEDAEIDFKMAYPEG